MTRIIQRAIVTCWKPERWRRTRRVVERRSTGEQTVSAPLFGCFPSTEDVEARTGCLEPDHAKRLLIARLTLSGGEAVRMTEVHILDSSELAARLTGIRVWLDDNRYEPSSFTYFFLHAGMKIQVSFKIDDEAEARPKIWWL